MACRSVRGLGAPYWAAWSYGRGSVCRLKPASGHCGRARRTSDGPARRGILAGARMPVPPPGDFERKNMLGDCQSCRLLPAWLPDAFI
jgi:hypothetical protein